MYTEPELLNERLERLAMVLDEIMPNCALLVRDALELLKGQDYRGWLMDMFHKYGRDDLIALLVLHGEEELLADALKEQEVVRCKDCRRYPECCRPRTNDPNWFCADGERREDNGQADGDTD